MEKEFEAWWEQNKIEFEVGILTEAFKEVSRKAWMAGHAAGVQLARELNDLR